MQKWTLAALLLFFTAACSSLSTLTSVTYIDPQKSFVLGEGNHGSYVADIQNVGQDDIEVIAQGADGISKSLGVLKVNEKGHYDVPANTRVSFKNGSTSDKGVIQIRIKGDTGLSMGYKEN